MYTATGRLSINLLNLIQQVECISLFQHQKRTLPSMTKDMTDMLEPIVVGDHILVFGIDCYDNILGERYVQL